jgi:hypothetical protein
LGPHQAVFFTFYNKRLRGTGVGSRSDADSHPPDAWLDRFPARPSRDPFYCRASVDQDDRLRIRAENLETAVAFLRNIKNRQSTGSGTKFFPPGSYTVHVEHAVEQAKMSRAIAKPLSSSGSSFSARPLCWMRPSIHAAYICWSGSGDDSVHPFVGMITEDAELAQLPKPVSVRGEHRHVLMLASNGHRLISLIRLYGGPVFRVHLGAPRIAAFEQTVLVDYRGAGMSLCNSSQS